MADTKISALTVITDPTGVEELAINDAGASKKESAGLLGGPAILLTSAYTLASQTAAQKAFNAPTNGAFTVKANTTYVFECFISLTALSGTSGSFGFALGGTATLTRQAWMALAQKAGALATPNTAQITFNTAANAALVTASTVTTGEMYIRGIVRVGAGGTIIPQVSLGVAAAAVVGTDSFFVLRPVGADTVQSVGNWS
jgi:hypothetical protein